MRFTAYLVIFLLLSYPPVINSIGFKDIGLQKLCDKLELSADQCCMADKTLNFLGYGGLVVATSYYGIPFVLAKLGFTATGIVSGSLAASWQSTSVAPRLFAMIQSSSMTGAATTNMVKTSIFSVGIKNYFSSCTAETSSTNSKNDKKNCNH